MPGAAEHGRQVGEEEEERRAVLVPQCWPGMGTDGGWRGREYHLEEDDDNTSEWVAGLLHAAGVTGAEVTRR